MSGGRRSVNNNDPVPPPPPAAPAAQVAMTQQQLTALLNGILAQMPAAGAGRNAGRNNAAPIYAVPPERVQNPTTGDMEDSPLGKRFQDGTDCRHL